MTPPTPPPIVEFHEVSKWYGNVIGINKLSLRIPPGVTGLLGPVNAMVWLAWFTVRVCWMAGAAV